MKSDRGNIPDFKVHNDIVHSLETINVLGGLSSFKYLSKLYKTDKMNYFLLLIAVLPSVGKERVNSHSQYTNILFNWSDYFLTKEIFCKVLIRNAFRQSISFLNFFQSEVWKTKKTLKWSALSLK